MKDIFSFFETQGDRDTQRREFAAVRIALASPEQIRAMSRGEVTRAETINYRTFKPERDGLFCARLFGPTRDFECLCGKYKRARHRGVVCEKCGVEVIASRVRRERMAHIALAAPVAHVWFLRGVPSRIGAVLDLAPRQLDRLLSGEAYAITKVAPAFEAAASPPATTRAPRARRRAATTGAARGDSARIRRGELLDEPTLARLREEYGEQAFTALTGGEALLELLRAVDTAALAEALRAEMTGERASEVRRRKAARRLRVVEALRRGGVRPEWMMLTVLPVLPPDLRPLVPLDGGRFATSDLNELYRRVINRNNRLKRLLELDAPEIIVRNEKRMLQEAVDALLDNGRGGRNAVTSAHKRPLKSLSDALKGKQGRFRQNLLGKRVDYSGRTVIVVGPDLRLHQCGLPKTMALELFRPFVYGVLEARGLAPTVRAARKMVDRGAREVWDALEEVIREHPVLLNRAPTLHRLGIQAFEPVLVEGKAIQLHPLVCAAFNADFDGDQMAVHVPLSIEAQTEARVLMMSTNNLLSPASGRPVVNPTQDMVLGLYELTRACGEVPAAGVFANPAELRAAVDAGELAHRARVVVRLDAVRVTCAGDTALAAGARVDPAEFEAENRAARRVGGRCAEGEPASRRVETTAGRVLLFDEACDAVRGGGGGERAAVEGGRADGVVLPFALFDREMNRKALAALVAECYRAGRHKATALLVDRLRTVGFAHATRSGLSIAVDDLRVPARKAEILAASRAQAAVLEERYLEGAITHRERHAQLVDLWTTQTADRVAEEMMREIGAKGPGGAPSDNPVYVMTDSGARGSKQQMRQLAGMRGLMARPSGEILETPITSNFREGLSVLEYFVSTHGARKGQADTSLKTANAGYLTRRLVDVAHDVTVTEWDCGALGGRTIARGAGAGEAGEAGEAFGERLIGRVAREAVVDPASGRVLVRAGEDLDEDAVRAVAAAAGVERVAVRSVLRCEARRGVCAACYGRDLSRGERVTVGEPVGIVAAQSIGEPGTQLTMQTFHFGGAVGEQSAERAGAAGGSAAGGSAAGGPARTRDITGGLPRVAELFEARKPRVAAVLAPVDGVVKMGREVRGKRQVFVVGAGGAGTATATATATGAGRAGDSGTGSGSGERVAEVLVARGRKIVVREGDAVRAGDVLVDGPAIDPHDVLRIHGDDALAEWLLEEIQRVYRLQGVAIHDKHVEVIVRQMLRRVRVVSAGQTELIVDELVDRARFERANAAAAKRALGAVLASGELVSAEVAEAVRRALAASERGGDAGGALEVLGERLSAVRARAAGGSAEGGSAEGGSADGGSAEGGSLVEREVGIVRERVREAFAVAEPVLLGITRASLGSESFFAAASFQETTRVLTDAALGGAVDELRGLKENLLLGRMVPAGTGLAALRRMAAVAEDEDGAQPAQDAAASRRTVAAMVGYAQRAR